MTRDEFMQRDQALRHAIQTGVLYEQGLDENAEFYRDHPELARILKHLRTGLNCAMCEHGTMVRLLLAKGVITEAEYFDASIKTLEEEVARYEKIIANYVGKAITLR